jgi:hypothetical protein
MSYDTCPDWPELMEIAPDLQFKHYTVRAAQLPAEALMRVPDLNLDEIEICCDIAGRPGAPGLALVRPYGVDGVGPRPPGRIAAARRR